MVILIVGVLVGLLAWYLAGVWYLFSLPRRHALRQKALADDRAAAVGDKAPARWKVRGPDWEVISEAIGIALLLLAYVVFCIAAVIILLWP